jgi:hypothetical protein
MLRVEGDLVRPIQRIAEPGAPWGIIVNSEPGKMELYKAEAFDPETVKVLLLMTDEEWEQVNLALRNQEEGSTAVPEDLKAISDGYKYLQSHVSTLGIFGQRAEISATAMDLTRIWAMYHFGRPAELQKVKEAHDEE